MKIPFTLNGVSEFTKETNTRAKCRVVDIREH